MIEALTDVFSFVGPIIIGACIAWLLQLTWEHFLIGRSVSLDGQWISHWRPHSKGSRKTWCTEHVYVAKRFGRLKFTNTDNSMGYEWEAFLKVYRMSFVYGKWRSRKSSSNAHGILNLTISSQGDYMYGTFHGPNDEGLFEMYPFALAKNDAALKIAKRRAQFLS